MLHISKSIMPGRSVDYYARVSTDGQQLTLPLDSLTEHGIALWRIFRDKLSGAKADRPGSLRNVPTPSKAATLWLYGVLHRSGQVDAAPDHSR